MLRATIPLLPLLSCLLRAIQAPFSHAKKAKFRLSENVQRMAGGNSSQRDIERQARARLLPNKGQGEGSRQPSTRTIHGAWKQCRSYPPVLG